MRKDLRLNLQKERQQKLLLLNHALASTPPLVMIIKTGCVAILGLHFWARLENHDIDANRKTVLVALTVL